MNDDLSMTAMEYALGTLPAEERALFSRQLADDPRARAALADWERKLSPLAGAIEPVEPDAAVWRALEQKLPAPVASDHAASGNVVTLRRSVTRWRFAATAMSALAACLALYVAVVRPAPEAKAPAQTASLQAPATPAPATPAPATPAPAAPAGPARPVGATEGGQIATASASRQNENLVVTANGARAGEIKGGLNIEPERKVVSTPSYVAALMPSAAQAALIVRVDPAAHVLTVRSAAAAVPQGSVLRLWLLGEGAPPRALGSVDGSTARLALPADAALADARIAATIEPAGSTPEAPRGPFVYEGRLLRE